MAVESVRKLVERYKEIRVILESLSKELEDLQKSHKAFWIRLEQECYKTCHDLTPEQLQWWHNYDNCAPANRTPITSLTIWQFKLALRGYECPYCRGHVGHQLRSWNPPVWDGYSKSSFESYLKQDITNCPHPKKALVEKAKKELTQYFAKAEPLEQRITSLQKERLAILNELEEIYKLSDRILGKSSDYESRIIELRRELYPRNPDDYYD